MRQGRWQHLAIPSLLALALLGLGLSPVQAQMDKVRGYDCDADQDVGGGRIETAAHREGTYPDKLDPTNLKEMAQYFFDAIKARPGFPEKYEGTVKCNYRDSKGETQSVYFESDGKEIWDVRDPDAP